MSQSFDAKKKTWTATFVYRDPLTNVRKYKKKRGFSSKREATRWEVEQKDAVNVVDDSATFRDMVARFEAFNQCSKESSRKHNEHLQFRCNDIADLPLRKLTRAVLVEWRNELILSDFSTNTKNQSLSFVRSILRYSSEVYGYPNESAVLKRIKKTKDEEMVEMSTWSPSEFNQFRNALEDFPIYQLFFDLLYWTGMRRGEAIALQSSDLSADGWLNIHASQRTAVEGLRPTKTKQSRKIKLVDWLNEELQPLRKEGGYLFGSDQSLAPTTINHIFQEGIKRSKVKPIRIHDLRHSFATNAINNGVNIVAVSKYLGHSSIEQTIKTYTHLLSESEDSLLKVLEKLANS